MKTIILGIVMSMMAFATPAMAEVRAGAITGFSLLEHTDTSLSHGPLRDEITVGRTWLVGGVLDVRLTAHDSVGFEFVYGPYHHDVDRACVLRQGIEPCQLEPFTSVSHALHYGMLYSHAFGRSSWRPYLGAGFGVKRYAYEEEFEFENTSATVSMVAGTESSTRVPVRIELRALVVHENPLLLDKNQVELQVRVSVLMSGRK